MNGDRICNTFFVLFLKGKGFAFFFPGEINTVASYDFPDKKVD